MKNDKLIILDYRTGRVIIIPSTTEDHELQVAEWAEKNKTTLEDCNWMVWDGEIEWE